MQNVLTCAQMRAADKYTIETLGVPSAELMERAGAAIAEEAEKLLREIGGRKVLAVCGGREQRRRRLVRGALPRRTRL